MVDKAAKAVKDKKAEETVTIEEEDLFEDFPPSAGDCLMLHLGRLALRMLEDILLVAARHRLASIAHRVSVGWDGCEKGRLMLCAGSSEVQHGKGEQEAELPLWEADWDDEDIGGDFVQHLKAELAKKS